MPAPSVFLKDFLGLIGVSVGPYVIREVVALGGVAVVYRAEHETMKSPVAVKVLTPEVVAEAVRPTLEQLFLREAQILGQLRSDDILRAYDHGRVLCGADRVERPYMVVEWLEGKVLSDDIEARRRMRRPYTLGECIELLLPVARALDVAHASGIVHRDVNPRNVFLESMGPGGPPRARLIDFGFAKDVAAQAQGLQLQQVAGTLFARSPDYAAPEHYDREAYGELSESTDVYTFALIFVEMLTLESPLRGDTAEVLAVATANEGDRPTPRRRGAQVSDAVEQLFVEALAINQFDRPQSVLEWFHRLEQVATPPPAAPEADALEPVLAPRPQRSLAALGVLLLLLLFVVGAGGVAWWFTRPLACPAGFADCNSERADGCEVEVASAASHCGRCNNACSTSLGEAACVAGACRIGRCPASHLGDCNSDIGDGCEVDTRSDPAHCGACGKTCGSQCAKKVSCEAGECMLSCKPTCGNCDDKPENGCEATLASDAQNCGRCGLICSGTACNEGLCATKSLGASGDYSFVAHSTGETFVWDRTGGAIRRRDAGGTDVAFAEGVRDLTGLVAAKDVVVWATGERAEVFALARGGGAPTRIAGPLLGPTPLAQSHSGRHVSWASRPKATPGKKPKLSPPGQRQIFTARLDAGISGAAARAAECPQYPSTFNGDDARQLCCAEGDALVALTCEGARCAERRYFVHCPRELLLDGERAYFTQDTRVMGMDLASGKPEQLAKRKKKPSELTLDATYIYWIEGPQEAELWRASKRASSEAKLGEAQLLARKQRRPRSLSIDGDQLLFVTSAPSDTSSALVILPLPKLKSPSP